MSGTERPNILLITVDQWPGHLLGAAGHPVIQTPTLDELCRNGRRFTNAQSECPICVPARRTLMTGASPRRHGDRVYDDQLAMPAETLAAAFTSAGYQTQGVGKLHVFPQRDRIGFEDVQLEEEGRAQYGVMDDYEIWLGDKGYDPVYGARPLKRVIQKDLVDPIARKLLAGEIEDGGVIAVSAGSDGLTIGKAQVH